MHIPRNAAQPFPRAGRWSLTAAALACVLTACGGSGGSTATPDRQGTLKVALTDAPACGFDHVYVTIEKIRVHQDNTADDSAAGWSEIALDEPRRIDLLALNNGALEELGATSLAAGRYTQLRLVLSGDSASGDTVPHAVVPTGGSQSRLTVPSGAQSGIKVQGAFEVSAGQTADLVLDFNACQSVRTAGISGAYQLKPVIALFPRVDGGIQGVLEGALANPGTTVAAQQDGVTVRSTTPDSRGNFRIPFLQPGSYHLVVAADGHATGLITNVPVASGATTVSTADTAIQLPASDMAAISGALSAAAEDAPAEGAAFTDAQVRALQAVDGAGWVEVRNRPVDTVLGRYRLSVPQSALVKAPYAATQALAFTPDAAQTGHYSVEVVLGADADTVE